MPLGPPAPLRHNPPVDYVVRLGAVTADLQRRTLHGAGRSDRLTANEASLLAYLAARRGVPISRHELHREVWGYAPEVVSRAVDFTVHRLRNKIESDPSTPTVLVSEHGVGYKLVPGAAGDPSLALPLPALVEPLVGRSREVSALERALAGSRITTVVGPPGVGKSRLVLSVAQGRRGAALASLGGTSRADEGLGQIARCLGVSFVGVEDDTRAAQRIGEALSAGSNLLILDDADLHLETLQRQVPAWVAGAPGLRVLVTSRRPLRLRGEHLLRLEPLTPESGAELLVSRAAAAGCIADDDPATRAAIADVVGRLDGLPLALELAASRVPLLGFGGLSDRLDRVRGLFTAREADRPPHHQTLEGALAWSWSTLEPGEQEALAQMSVFEGAFSLEAAEHVVRVPGAEVFAVLDRLVESSWVQTTHQRGRVQFRLLAVTRHHARRRLGDSAAPEAAGRRHAEHFVRVARRSLGPGDQLARSTTLLELLEQRADLTAARGRADAADERAALAVALDFVFQETAPLDRRLLRLDEALSDEPSPDLRARLLLARSWALQGQGRLDEAAADAEAALAWADGVDPTVVATLWLRLAIISAKQEDVAAASAQVERAVDAAPDTPRLRGRVGMARGRIALARGDLEGYVDHTRLGLAAMDGDEGVDVALVRSSLASALTARGEHAAAAEQLRRAEPTIRASGQAHLIGAHEGRLGTLALHVGDFPQAVRNLSSAVTRQLAAGMRRAAAVNRTNLGWALMEAGEHEQARLELEAALMDHRRVGDRRVEAVTLVDLGVAMRVAGAPAEAEARLLEANAILEASEDRRSHVTCLAHLAELRAERGDPEGAHDALAAAEHALEAVRSPHAAGRLEFTRAHLDRALRDVPPPPELLVAQPSDVPELRVARALLSARV